MKNIFDFSGKTILVTGASSGIGRQTAVDLSECGARTVLVARREDKLKETMSMLSGEGHIYRTADLSELENIEALVTDIVGETGKLDGLAFCAGIADTRPYTVSNPDFMLKMLKTNFLSYYELVRQFAKKKNSNDGSKIVVISSITSQRPGKGQSGYAASKGAIDSTVVNMAKELVPRKININSIRPGGVDTPMMEGYYDRPEKGIEDLYKEQPLGLIEPSAVSSLIIYLLSSAADKITGTSILIDGGRSF